MLSLFSWLFIFHAQVHALKPSQALALDQLLQERKTAASKLGTPVRDATIRLDAFEKRMLPVVFTFNRLGPLVIQRNAELDALKIYLEDDKNSVNPYDDTNWIESARKETAYVCCDVRRNPGLAQEIQENLAKGIPALSSATSQTVADRARAAAKASSGTASFDDNTEEGPTGVKPGGSAPVTDPAPAPEGTSAPANSNRKGMISGLPDLNSAPAPAIPPPAGAGASPAVPAPTATGAPVPPAPAGDPAGTPASKPPVTP